MKKVFWKILKKYKLSIFLIVLFVGLNIYVLTLPSKIIGNVVDLLYDLEKNKNEIILNTYYLMGVLVLAMLTRLPWKYFTGYTPRSIERDLKNKLFEQFTKIKMSHIQKIKNGEIMSYFVKDVNEIRRAINRVLSFGTRISFTFIIAGFTMASSVNLKLTIMTLLPILLTAYVIVIIKKYVEKSFAKSQNNFTELSEYVQESTDAIRTTKAYSQEYYQLKEFMRKDQKLKTSNNEVDVHSTLLHTVADIGFGLCYGISLIYGSKLVLANEITVGDLVAFNGYISLFVGPVSWIPNLITYFKRAQISYKRLDNFFNLDREKIDVKSEEMLEKLEGNIQIQDLTFNYPETIDMVLENININLKKGESLGIIGTIAAGKTTLLNLLTGLYPVKRGKIFIDGKDINDISLPVLRENISYITQDNFLFSSTLKENINLFRDIYEKTDIDDSTKNAMIYDEIRHMPEQIETNLGGETGVELSGGQKQRIAVSRAFLKRSNIIFFDDTFSALDNRTEKALLDNIKQLTENKTCIIVSNRISDVKDCDKIIVMDGGRIVEEGRHEELLSQEGLYHSFYISQSKKGGDIDA